MSITGDLCVFRCGTRCFGLSTAWATEVIEPRPLTAMPGAAADLLGVFNLRGEAVALVAPEHVLAFEAGTAAVSATWIVVGRGDRRFGLAADNVLGVVHLAPWEGPRDPVKSQGAARGEVEKNGSSFTLLDPEALLDEVARLLAEGFRAALAGSPGPAAGSLLEGPNCDGRA